MNATMDPSDGIVKNTVVAVGTLVGLKLGCGDGSRVGKDERLGRREGR